MRKRVTDKVLDVKGLLCPVPTVMTEKTLKEMKKGDTLQVITNDITTRESIPSVCIREGYMLLESIEEDGLIYFIIRR